MVSKWSELERPWQVCMEEAWAAFCAGSLPIGSAIFDADGNLLARGRNHIYDDHVPAGQVSLHQLAHAELNTLLQVDRRNVDLHSCVLYSSMEPCPLCMGAVYMSGVRTLYYAARDDYAGSTNLLGTTQYLSRKAIKVRGPAYPDLEKIFLALLVNAELRRVKTTGWELYEEVTTAWRKVCLPGVVLGDWLEVSGLIPKWLEEGAPAEVVFDTLTAVLARE